MSLILKRYYMLNKPAGLITACSDARQPTVMECFPSEERLGLFPIGRLDKDTEGLLIFTDDGTLAFEIMSPKSNIDKTYLFYAKGCVDDEKLSELCTGVKIYKGKDFTTLPAEVNIIERTTVKEVRSRFDKSDDRFSHRYAETPITVGTIKISEGKKHQVKRMVGYTGAKVIYLRRIAIGNLHLDERLLPGEYRALTASEVNMLLKKSESL